MSDAPWPVVCRTCGKMLAERDRHNLYVKRGLAVMSYGLVTLRCPDERCRALTVVDLSSCEAPAWAGIDSARRVPSH
jgi:hypothetical protein